MWLKMRITLVILILILTIRLGYAQIHTAHDILFMIRLQCGDNITGTVPMVYEEDTELDESWLIEGVLRFKGRVDDSDEPIKDPLTLSSVQYHKWNGVDCVSDTPTASDWKKIKWSLRKVFPKDTKLPDQVLAGGTFADDIVVKQELTNPDEDYFGLDTRTKDYAFRIKIDSLKIGFPMPSQKQSFINPYTHPESANYKIVLNIEYKIFKYKEPHNPSDPDALDVVERKTLELANRGLIVKDITKPDIEVIQDFFSGRTGDPLCEGGNELIFKVTDNNPFQEIEEIEISFNRGGSIIWPDPAGDPAYGIKAGSITRNVNENSDVNFIQTFTCRVQNDFLEPSPDSVLFPDKGEELEYTIRVVTKYAESSGLNGIDYRENIYDSKVGSVDNDPPSIYLMVAKNLVDLQKGKFDYVLSIEDSSFDPVHTKGGKITATLKRKNKPPITASSSEQIFKVTSPPVRSEITLLSMKYSPLDKKKNYITFIEDTRYFLFAKGFDNVDGEVDVYEENDPDTVRLTSRPSSSGKVCLKNTPDSPESVIFYNPKPEAKIKLFAQDKNGNSLTVTIPIRIIQATFSSIELYRQ